MSRRDESCTLPWMQVKVDECTDGWGVWGEWEGGMPDGLSEGRFRSRVLNIVMCPECLDSPIMEMNEEVPPSRVCDAHLLLEDNNSGKLLMDPPSYLCVDGILRTDRMV